MAMRRIIKEFQVLETEPPLPCNADSVDEDLFHWLVSMRGPKGTPYSEGVFDLEVRFPLDYPFAPPKILFNTKIYHPNINSNGNICLDILKDEWSPVLTISKIILSISSLLSDPNPNDPLVTDIAKLYRDDIEAYNKKAREWTLKWAKAPSKIFSFPDEEISEEFLESVAAPTLSPDEWSDSSDELLPPPPPLEQLEISTELSDDLLSDDEEIVVISLNNIDEVVEIEEHEEELNDETPLLNQETPETDSSTPFVTDELVENITNLNINQVLDMDSENLFNYLNSLEEPDPEPEYD